jgi:hypothetical protein
MRRVFRNDQGIVTGRLVYPLLSAAIVLLCSQNAFATAYCASASYSGVISCSDPSAYQCFQDSAGECQAAGYTLFWGPVSSPWDSVIRTRYSCNNYTNTPGCGVGVNVPEMSIVTTLCFLLLALAGSVLIFRKPKDIKPPPTPFV